MGGTRSFFSFFGAAQDRPPRPELPRERRHGPRDIGKTALGRVVYRLYHEELPLLSAGVALFGVLSLMPALGAMISIYGLLSSPADIRDQIAPLARIVPSEVVGVIVTQLESAAAAPGQALGLTFATSVALALFSATSGVRSLMTAINIAHNRADTRPFLRRMSIAFAFGIGSIVSIMVAVGLIVLLPSALALLHLQADTAALVNVLRWPTLIILVVGALAVIYRALPVNPTHRALPGVLVATILWIASSYGLSIYVDRVAHSNALYGAFGGVMILILWFYLSSFVIVLGAVVNEELEQARWRPGVVVHAAPTTIDAEPPAPS
jgi:membrane protein